MPLNRRQMLGTTALTGAAVVTASSGLLATSAAQRGPVRGDAGPVPELIGGPNPLFPPLQSASG